LDKLNKIGRKRTAKGNKYGEHKAIGDSRPFKA
jgi:hypothetical protein